MTNSEVVRSLFAAYRAQDRGAAMTMLANDFVFTSPQDDHIDKATYLDRCFPTASRFRWQRLLHVLDISDEDVFVLYEYELHTGARYRNVEVITVRDGEVVETQVYFGGRGA